MKEEKDLSALFISRIGENITKKRKEKKLSLEKFGLEIGLTRMQVFRIEQGYNITVKTLLKIALALDLKPEELVKFDYRIKRDDLERLLNSKKATKK
ncbi:MAG: helix-turn-helix domain-containing protein [Bacteroidia bacterium]|jgi:transcriptional regulator with XRE-family HTH domain